MSENQIPEGTSEASAKPDEKKAVSYDSHRKLLDEKKKMQAELEVLRAEKDMFEQSQLEEQGQLQKVIENLKGQISKEKDKNLNLAKTVKDKVTYAAFAREAEKLGCQDPKMAFMALDLSDLDINDDWELDNEKLTEKLNDLTKTKSFLFKKEVSLPNDVIPSSKQNHTKDLSNLTDEQLIQLL